MLSTFWGSLVEGTKYTNSELSFFQNSALLEGSGDTKADEKYAFIGLIKKEFKDTNYLKNEWFKKDIDILRHFGAERIFLYELKGFLSLYGWEGIIKLGLHNQQHKSWKFQYNNFRSIIFLFFYCSLIVLDILICFELDLS